MTKAFRYIQRNTINRPLGDFNGKILSNAVDHDYMGSSEFEWGALPKSMRRMQALHSAGAMKRVKVEDIVENDKPLFVYHGMSDADYAKWMVELRRNFNGDKTQFTQEPTYFERASRVAKNYRSEIDLWWDIENDVFWSFDKNFMKRLETHLLTSWKYMDEKAKEREFLKPLNV